MTITITNIEFVGSSQASTDDAERNLGHNENHHEHHHDNHDDHHDHPHEHRNEHHHENRKLSKPTKENTLVAGRNGFKPKVIILPQLLYAVAFLASIYSTTSCNYITANYDYSMEQSYLKSKVGYGMLSRQSASTESDQCHWYSVNDVDSFFDTPFRVAAAASTLATLIGGLNFIYSLFLWCRVVTGSSIRFLCYVTIFCVVCEAITQVIFVTEVCMIDTCSKLPDGTDGSCVRSHCSLGMGSYFAFVALFVWLICLCVTIRLLQKARRQYEDQKRRIRAINEVAFTDVEDAFDDGGRNIPPVVVDESEKEENDTTKEHKHGKKKEESTSHWSTMLAGFMGDYSTDDGSKIPSTIQI